MVGWLLAQIKNFENFIGTQKFQKFSPPPSPAIITTKNEITPDLA